METAEWIGDPTKARSVTLSLDGASVTGQRLAALHGVRGRDRSPASGRAEPGEVAGILPQDHHRLPLDRSLLDYYRSHDRAFLENIGCERRIEIRGGRLQEQPAPTTG